MLFTSLITLQRFKFNSIANKTQKGRNNFLKESLVKDINSCIYLHINWRIFHQNDLFGISRSFKTNKLMLLF